MKITLNKHFLIVRDESRKDMLDELMGFNDSNRSLLSECSANNSVRLREELIESEMINSCRISNIEAFKDIVAVLDIRIEEAMVDMEYF